MELKDIVKNILTKNPDRIAEAKAAIKETLTARADQFKVDAKKFVGRKLFESTVNETHTLNGPFPVGTVVTDEIKGITGVISKAPFGDEHIHTVHFADRDPANYGPEDIPKLRQVDNEDNLPDAIKALKGLFAPKG